MAAGVIRRSDRWTRRLGVGYTTFALGLFNFCGRDVNYLSYNVIAYPMTASFYPRANLGSWIRFILSSEWIRDIYHA